MLTGASPTTNGDGSIEGAMSGVKDARNVQQFIAASAEGVRAGLPAGGDRWDRDQAAHGCRSAEGAERRGERPGNRRRDRREGRGCDELSGRSAPAHGALHLAPLLAVLDRAALVVE